MQVKLEALPTDLGSDRFRPTPQQEKYIKKSWQNQLEVVQKEQNKQLKPKDKKQQQDNWWGTLLLKQKENIIREHQQDQNQKRMDWWKGLEQKTRKDMKDSVEKRYLELRAIFEQGASSEVSVSRAAVPQTDWMG